MPTVIRYRKRDLWHGRRCLGAVRRFYLSFEYFSYHKNERVSIAYLSAINSGHCHQMINRTKNIQRMLASLRWTNCWHSPANACTHGPTKQFRLVLRMSRQYAPIDWQFMVTMTMQIEPALSRPMLRRKYATHAPKHIRVCANFCASVRDAIASN